MPPKSVKKRKFGGILYSYEITQSKATIQLPITAKSEGIISLIGSVLTETAKEITSETLTNHAKTIQSGLVRIVILNC
jgi:hypothetical protein